MSADGLMISEDGKLPRGLPGPLPDGETLIWQGAPCWKSFARRVFHVRLVMLYFVGLLIWGALGGLSDGQAHREVALSSLRLTGLAIAALAVMALLAWLISRTTVYTITDRRIVIRSGIAFQATVNIPFKYVESAGLKTYPDGSGDIQMSLGESERIAYLLLWPNARPWRMSRAEPMLRTIPNARGVAEILGAALAGAPLQQIMQAPVERIPAPLQTLKPQSRPAREPRRANVAVGA